MKMESRFAIPRPALATALLSVAFCFSLLIGDCFSFVCFFFPLFFLLSAQLLAGNSNPWLAAVQPLEAPIVAERLRFLPYSHHPRTTWWEPFTEIRFDSIRFDSIESLVLQFGSFLLLLLVLLLLRSAIFWGHNPKGATTPRGNDSNWVKTPKGNDPNWVTTPRGNDPMG